MDSDTLVIFMHIPKTGGTTLVEIINRQYYPNQGGFYGELNDTVETLLTFEKTGHVKCFYGHFYFGIHRYVSRPYTYITFVRHPIEQTISMYYQIRRDPNNPFYQNVAGLKFEEYVEFSKKMLLANFQTSIVSGGTNCLETAKENLRQYFTVVGITERFEESLFLLKKELCWNIDDYVYLNATPERPARDSFSEDVIHLVTETNNLDFELYEYATNLFESKIQALAPKEREELQLFLNRVKRKDPL